MKKILLVVVVLLSPLVALADEKLDKALGLCQAEVQYFGLTTGKVNKVVFPNNFHLKDMPNSYFIEYRDDLKAGAHLKSGKKQALDVRCHIQKGVLNAFYVKINGRRIDTFDSINREMEYVKREIDYLSSHTVDDFTNTTSTSNSQNATAGSKNVQSNSIANIAYIEEGKFYIPGGLLNNYINEIGDKDFYLLRKNGTAAHWPNDIKKLCKDFVLYKNQILEYSKKHKFQEVELLELSQSQLEATNQWLNLYDKHDVQTMFSYLNKRSLLEQRIVTVNFQQ